MDDLNFILSITNSCNLHCDYCPIVHTNESISYEMLDSYIEFFQNNQQEIYKYCNSVVMAFFGGEPLLCSDKLCYFFRNTRNLSMKYGVLTNGIPINKEVLDNFSSVLRKDRFTFYVSIDGGKDIMLKHRLDNLSQFEKILQNIELLKSKNINFSFSKMILKEGAEELYNNLLFLHKLGPEKIEMIPVTDYYKEGFGKKEIEEILKGFDMFINFLKEEGYSKLNILEYFGLPDGLQGFEDLYNVDCGLAGDIDGNIYGLLDAVSAIEDSLTKEEKRKTLLTNIREDAGKIIDTLKDYSKFENEMRKIGKERVKKSSHNELLFQKTLNMFFIKRLLL